MPKPAKPPIRAVLFDLDGTLMDTAPDLAWALNQVRQEEGLAALPYLSIRPHVSNGSVDLIRFGFDSEVEDADFERRRLRLLEIYAANLTRETTLFSGMAEILATLEASGLLWGVVTNKPAWLTDPLMLQMGLSHRAACIVSGDTTVERKPHPQPLFHAARLMGIDSTECVYVGDADRDIEAGRRAGMKTLIASFGYIDDQEDLSAWQADAVIQTPTEILEWLTTA